MQELEHVALIARYKIVFDVSLNNILYIVSEKSATYLNSRESPVFILKDRV